MSVELAMLQRCLAGFEALDVRYVLAGEDPSGLNEGISGDVDIVVDRRDFQKIRSVVARPEMPAGARFVQILQHESTAYYFVLSWKEEGWRYLKLDICSDYLRNARLLLTANELLDGRRKDADTGFYVSAPEKNLLYYLLKKVDKGSVNSEQFAYLRKNLAECRQDILPELCRFWSEEQSREIFQCLDANDQSRLEGMIPGLKSALRKRCRPSIKSWVQNVVRICRRVMQPTGVWIAILGPDGCGKSSVIDQLLPNLEPAFRRTALMHFRPKVGYRGPADNSHAADPHNQPDRNPVSSILKLGYYAGDYIFGYFLKVLPARVRSTFLVFDRYYDDLLVDQKRYCYGGPVWLLKMIRLFIPKPDLVFCLDAPAEVLQARKQEVPFEVTARQRELYKQMVSKLRNGHVIDASQSLDKVVLDVESVVLKFMERRTQRRMRCSLVNGD